MAEIINNVDDVVLLSGSAGAGAAADMVGWWSRAGGPRPGRRRRRRRPPARLPAAAGIHYLPATLLCRSTMVGLRWGLSLITKEAQTSVKASENLDKRHDTYKNHAFVLHLIGCALYYKTTHNDISSYQLTG